jgi:rhodanese-related sulfurtransferase
MPWSDADIQANKKYFAEKLSAIQQRDDVVKAIEADSFDFILLDTRGREPFKAGHIKGAWCAPMDEFQQVVAKLPRDREIVTYCWGHD